MNREHGYTLIETLLTMVVVVILGASGLYGWQSWQRQQRSGLYGWQRQRQQRLWQTACQVRDYLVLLRDDANWHNRDRVLSVGQSAEGWCLSASGPMADCRLRDAFTLQPLWPEVRSAR
jgi:prepilin peptidase dependent protein A